MRHARVLEQIREIVRTHFAAHGVATFGDFSESILIRDGFYCGRSFASGGLRAVWFVEENLLKFFDRDNRLLQSQMVDEESPKPVNHAAAA